MGKLKDQLKTGSLKDYEEVRSKSAELIQELIDEMGDVRGSKQELAKDLNISPCVLSNILAGKRKVPADVLKKLMEA
jgi:hypothetical protein